MSDAKKLTNLQLELLKMFQLELSEAQLQDVKALLVNYFAQKIDTEMDVLWDENAWNEQTVEAWASEHLRRSDKSQEQAAKT